jgi:hypothetical protein
VNNCTLTGNSAHNNGGGIYNSSIGGNSATLTVSDSTISTNSAAGQKGGGIFNDGSTGGNATLTVIACTINGNSAFDGGGICNDGSGGGSASLKVNVSTFYNNTAINGGGIFNNGNSFTMTAVSASTLSSNSAGQGDSIYNSGGALTIGNTILKAGSSGVNIVESGGTHFSYGFNLSSDNGNGFLTNEGDQTFTDPMLGPLTDNGGPTPTMMPLPGSPAIDQGRPDVVPNLTSHTDQRGRYRPYDDPGVPNGTGSDATDIGAVEVSSPHGIVGTANDGFVGPTLRYTLLDAQPGDTITFSNIVTGTITLTNGEVLVDKNVTIQGPGAKVLAISGNAASRVFRITNATANVSGLTITNGNAGTGDGGGILNDHATLTVTRCVLAGNAANGGGALGGGIANGTRTSGSATLTVIASTLSGNSAVGGAGICNNGTFAGSSATLMVSNCTFSANSASSIGGGLYNDGVSGSATLTVIASTFSGNSASFSGGGILNNAISGSATARIGDTLLNAGTGANIANLNSGTFTSLGYNLSSDNGAGFLTATGDQISTNPLLGPLADNGGPTPTHALLAGSPAIDKGKSFGVTSDQRGLTRPVDDPCIANATGGDGSDIGAFEAQDSCANFRITAVAREANNIRVTWATYANKTNALERTAGAAGSFATNNFAAIFTVTNTVGTTTNYLDTGAATNVPAFYYRVRLVP